MSATTTLKKLTPLTKVYGGAKTAYGQLRTPADRTDNVERLHALASAVLAVTSLVLMIRALRESDQE